MPAQVLCRTYCRWCHEFAMPSLNLAHVCPRRSRCESFREYQSVARICRCRYRHSKHSFRCLHQDFRDAWNSISRHHRSQTPGFSGPYNHTTPALVLLERYAQDITWSSLLGQRECRNFALVLHYDSCEPRNRIPRHEYISAPRSDLHN
mmetsp:Transcript_55608/g.133034  ORF Transcript_55608/g.133034 Transcript_55608/m.133034 type:complete len:149 (-) Transcript_55608:133-579(-)